MRVVTQICGVRRDMVEGDLCVWWMRDLIFSYYPVASVDEAATLLRKLGKADLVNLAVGMNAGGLEVYQDLEWEEWYSEDGDSIDDIMDEEDE